LGKLDQVVEEVRIRTISGGRASPRKVHQKKGKTAGGEHGSKTVGDKKGGYKHLG